MKDAGLPLSQFSVPSFTISSIIIFAYVGLLPLYFGWDEYRYDVGITDSSIVMEMLIITVISMLFMIFGFKIGAIFKGRISKAYSSRTLNSREFIALCGFIILSIVVLIDYISNLSSIALFVAIAEGSQESKVARSLMGNDFAGKYHWYKLFIHELLTVTSYALFVNYLSGRSVKYLFVFMFSFFLTSFAHLMSTEKSPFLWYLIGIFLIYTIQRNNSVYKMNGIFKLSVLFLAILIYLYILFMGSESSSDAIESILSRTFTGGIGDAYFYLDFFPKQHDYLLGLSFPNPGGLLPFEPYPLTKEIMSWVSPENRTGGIVGSSPTIFWGEIYANFGYFAIPIISLILGYIVYYVTYLCTQLESGPIKTAFIVWLAMHYMHLSDTGFSGFIFDVNLYIISTLIIIIIFYGSGSLVSQRFGANQR